MRSREQNSGKVGSKRVVGVVLMGIALLHVAALAARAGAFATSDLEGTWDLHALSVGDSPQWVGWYYGTQDIDAAGNLTFTSWEKSDGDSNLPDPEVMALSPTGIVTVAGLDLRGIMNTQKNMVVGVLTSGGDSNDLFISLKRGSSTFSDSDFAGTWNWVDLVSGDSPGQTPGWLWGAFTFDTNGDLTSASAVTDSLGSPPYTPSGISFDLTSDGIVTESGGWVRGVMNSGKDMMVLVGTMCPASDPGIEGYNLLIFVKDTGATYLTECMAGVWNYHSLVSGDSPQWTGWAYGSQTADATGLFTFTSNINSDGVQDLPGDITVSVSPAGVLTIAGTDYHGLVNWRKGTAVGVMTDGGGGYSMVVDLRSAGSVWKRDDSLPDFSGDGKSDLLWRQASTGYQTATLMDGLTMGSSGWLGGTTDWQVVGTPDLNSDGKSDLLWRQASGGYQTAAIMDGVTMGGSGWLGGNTDWPIVATPDLDGDGKADMLWRQVSTGYHTATLMDGVTMGSSGWLGGNFDWQIVATPDLNGDGKADLLWRQASTGYQTATLMDGLTMGSSGWLGGTLDWQIVAAPDLNGDGKADLLWRQLSTGYQTATLMDGLTMGSSGWLGGNTDWQIVTSPDFNGDGKADLLWRQLSTGYQTATLMDGLTMGSSGWLGGNTDWQIVAVGDFDGDGKSDLLWRQWSTGYHTTTIMDGLTPADAGWIGGDGDWRVQPVP